MSSRTQKWHWKLPFTYQQQKIAKHCHLRTLNMPSLYSGIQQILPEGQTTQMLWIIAYIILALNNSSHQPEPLYSIQGRSYAPGFSQFVIYALKEILWRKHFMIRLHFVSYERSLRLTLTMEAALVCLPSVMTPVLVQSKIRIIQFIAVFLTGCKQ